MWIPDSPPLRRLGVTGDRDAARPSLDALAGARSTPDDAERESKTWGKVIAERKIKIE